MTSEAMVTFLPFSPLPLPPDLPLPQWELDGPCVEDVVFSAKNEAGGGGQSGFLDFMAPHPVLRPPIYVLHRGVGRSNYRSWSFEGRLALWQQRCQV